MSIATKWNVSIETTKEWIAKEVWSTAEKIWAIASQTTTKESIGASEWEVVGSDSKTAVMVMVIVLWEVVVAMLASRAIIIAIATIVAVVTVTIIGRLLVSGIVALRVWVVMTLCLELYEGCL